MVIVDRLQTVAAWQILADAAADNPSRDYVGQTFVAADSQLDSIDFFIDSSGSGGPNPFHYRLLVVSVTADDNGFHPDKILFESGVLSEPVDASFAITR